MSPRHPRERGQLAGACDRDRGSIGAPSAAPSAILEPRLAPVSVAVADMAVGMAAKGPATTIERSVRSRRSPPADRGRTPAGPLRNRIKFINDGRYYVTGFAKSAEEGKDTQNFEKCR